MYICKLVVRDLGDIRDPGVRCFAAVVWPAKLLQENARHMDNDKGKSFEASMNSNTPQEIASVAGTEDGSMARTSGPTETAAVGQR